MSITGVKEALLDYAIFYNDITCLSDINCSGLSVCNSINNLSSQSNLNISNLQSTSNTIFNNLNNLSTNSIFSINSLSSQSNLNISNLQSTSNTIFNNLNNLSTNSIFSINNLSYQSSLNISNLQSTSNTIFNNLNNLSTNSIFSINNLSYQSSLNISNLQNTSNTIFNNLNNLSTQSNLDISYISTRTAFLNGTSLNLGSGGLIAGVITFPSTLSTSGLIGDVVLRSGNGSKLILQSGSGSAGMYINGSNNVVLDNDTTVLSKLNVSGNSVFDNNVSINNTLNVNQATFTNSLNVSGFSSLNNTTILSTLNISGRTIIGSDINNYSDSVLEAYKNLTIRKNVPGLVGFGERIDLNVGSITSTSFLSIEEGKNINLYASIGNINFNATKVNVLNDLNIIGNAYATNIPKKSQFTIVLNGSYTIGSTSYSRYDIDLTKYTKYITVSNAIGNTTTRKFNFICNLATGAHNSGLYSLNYDIDYSYLNYTGLGTLPTYNGLNAVAYGFPYDNFNLNKVTPNGLFIWKNSFDYITVYGKSPFELQVTIIDYL